MQPKIHVVEGVSFVATPYRAGTFIREDVFWRQFTITCCGEVEYPEDDPVYGTWWAPCKLALGQRGLIEDAMAMAAACVANDEFELNFDSDALGFRPELVLVHDELGRLVLAGQVWATAIRWCEPVLSDDDIAAVAKQVEYLRVEAAFEAGWDNHCTAAGLRLPARVLAGRVVDPFWRKHALRAVQAAAAIH
jgi:hypothetical protein